MSRLEIKARDTGGAERGRENLHRCRAIKKIRMLKKERLIVGNERFVKLNCVTQFFKILYIYIYITFAAISLTF